MAVICSTKTRAFAIEGKIGRDGSVCPWYRWRQIFAGFDAGAGRSTAGQMDDGDLVLDLDRAEGATLDTRPRPAFSTITCISTWSIRQTLRLRYP